MNSLLQAFRRAVAWMASIAATLGQYLRRLLETQALRSVFRALKRVASPAVRVVRYVWEFFFGHPKHVLHLVALIGDLDAQESPSPYHRWQVHNRNSLPDSPSFA